jgi:hypothetical protein
MMTTKPMEDGDEGGVEIDAEIIARGFGIEPHAVPGMLRERAIVARHYRGEGEDAGTSKLVFFHGNARLTVIVDDSGKPIRQSVVDFGVEPLPAAMRRP